MFIMLWFIVDHHHLTDMADQAVLTPIQQFYQLKDSEKELYAQVRDLRAQMRVKQDEVSKEFEDQINVLTEQINKHRLTRAGCLVDILSHPEDLEFDEWQNTTTKFLHKMSITQTEFLVWKVSGQVNKFRTTTHPDGDHINPPDIRKAENIRFLKQSGCRYCHGLFHQINDCNERPPCHKCGGIGHPPKKCRNNAPTNRQE
jgi:hypothetical protein